MRSPWKYLEGAAAARCSGCGSVSSVKRHEADCPYINEDLDEYPELFPKHVRGCWDVEVTYYTEDGKLKHSHRLRATKREAETFPMRDYIRLLAEKNYLLVVEANEKRSKALKEGDESSGPRTQEG
jgi:LSD1 subclass zinc finger protein